MKRAAASIIASCQHYMPDSFTQIRALVSTSFKVANVTGIIILYVGTKIDIANSDICGCATLNTPLLYCQSLKIKKQVGMA